MIINLPKTLLPYENRIAEYSDERASGNGIWIYYRNGLKSYTDPVGNQHQDHEDTVREIAYCVRNAMPCDCGDCK